LSDGYIAKELPIREWGYQPKSRPESEEVVPKAEEETPRKWWQSSRNPFWNRSKKGGAPTAVAPVVEEDWDLFKE
jgi:hypothetical protein